MVHVMFLFVLQGFDLEVLKRTSPSDPPLSAS